MGIYERNYYREENELDLRPNWDQRSAVSTLIIINVAVFVANMILSKSFDVGYQGVVNELLMLSDNDLGHPLLWWRTLTYGFCHDALSIWHLLFNMMGLYFLGRSVEHRYGKTEFYWIYLFTIVICGVVWLFKQQFSATDNRAVLLGASGAVLCIEMLFVFNFPTSRVYLLVFPVPAWVLGILLVLMNFSSNPSTGIATDVHLTGILCAAAYFFLGLNFRLLGDLKGSWRRWLRRHSGPKLKIHNESASAVANDAEEADRILAKIHESGQDSLSSKERKFLEKYSRSVRAKKLDI